MTGNQIVGGNLSYPKTTRNMGQNNQIMFNSQQEDVGFDNSMIVDGPGARNGAVTNIDGSVHITEISSAKDNFHSSFLGSEVKHREEDISHDHPGVSQTTQETSKQVFGKQMISPGSLGISKQSGYAGKVTNEVSLTGELPSIKENDNGSFYNRNVVLPTHPGLIQEDSIIEND